MHNYSGNGSRAAWARGFTALWAMLALALGATASPAEAAPFAYVANDQSGNVSVIDTATNRVVATVAVGGFPDAVAVTPDGKHAYVANGADGTVSVIDTATNMVVATVTAGAHLPEGQGIAITPDGKHAYVTNENGTVSVIDTASNTVVGIPIQVGSDPIGIAITPDGKHAYVTNFEGNFGSTVSVIDTASNTVVGTPIQVGSFPKGSPSPRMGNTPMS